MKTHSTELLATCPVAADGRQLGRVIDAIRWLDEAEPPTAEENQVRRINAERELDFRQGALEDAILAGAAQSLGGAAAQLIVAIGTLDRLTFVNEKGRADNRNIVRAIERGLYSALSVVAEAAGVDPDTMGRDYYAPVRLDPHKILTEAVRYPVTDSARASA